MLEGLKNFYFKELPPLPQSAEASGIWPFTGNPRKWIDPTHPEYTPSIYADRPMIDVTGSGIINPVGSVAKSAMSALRKIVPEIGDMVKLPGGKARFDGVWEAIGDSPEQYQYTYHEGLAKGDTFVSASHDIADVSAAGIKKLKMRGAVSPDESQLLKKSLKDKLDTLVKEADEIIKEFEPFSFVE